MDQSAFFGLLQNEAAARQSLAEELLGILQDNGVVDPALEDARRYGSNELNELLFGRGEYIPVLVPATKFGALRQLVSGRPRLMPAADPARPFAPPPELPALPPPPELPALPAPEPLAVFPEAEAIQPPAFPLPPPEILLPAPEAPEPVALPAPGSGSAPAAPPPEAEPEPAPAADPEPPAAILPLPTPVEKTPMSDSPYGGLNPSFPAAASPAIPMPDAQEQIVLAKCLQKVSNLMHVLMANRDTYSEAVAEAMNLPVPVLDSMASGKAHEVPLGTVLRVLLYLGAPNLALIIPGPRQPASGR